MIALTLRSGGQSGVDRAALDLAFARGLAYAGWCPKGGWAEDCPAPPGLLALYPRLAETPSKNPAQRTAWNVRDGDATLILARGAALTGGTLRTARCAQALARPCLVVDLAAATDASEVARWLARLPPPLVLNVAGPRESNAPGIHADASRFLDAVLRSLLSD